MKDGHGEGMKDTLQEVFLLEFLQVMVRRKRLIMKLCAVAAIASAVVSLILPNSYTATAKILPPPKESGSAIAALVGQGGGMAGLAGLASGMGLGGNADLYLGILRSRSVADAVIKRLDLRNIFKKKTVEETRKVLEQAVKMKAGNKDGIISIVAESKDPRLAALLANTFVEELGRKSVLMNLSKAGTERVFLETRINIVKEDLTKAEEALRSFQLKNKAIKVDSQAAAAIQGVARLKAEIISREVQLATLKSYQTDENQEVKSLQTAINKLRSQLSGLIGGSGSGDGIPNMGNAPNLGIEYLRRVRDLKTQEAIFEQLTKQYEIAKLNEAKDSSSLQVLDEAVVPMKKSKPKRSLIVILVTVTTFFIGVFLAFMMEYFAKMPEEERVSWGEVKRMLFARKEKI